MLINFLIRWPQIYKHRPIGILWIYFCLLLCKASRRDLIVRNKVYQNRRLICFFSYIVHCFVKKVFFACSIMSFMSLYAKDYYLVTMLSMVSCVKACMSLVSLCGETYFVLACNWHFAWLLDAQYAERSYRSIYWRLYRSGKPMYNHRILPERKSSGKHTSIYTNLYISL